MKKIFDDIPLHINILSIFILLIAILSGGILYTTYKGNADAALHSADRLLEEIGEKITERTARVFDPAFLLADEATLLPDLSIKPDLYGHPAAPLLMRILSQEPSILSAYIGYADGDFLMLSHIGDASARVRDNLRAPLEAHYSVQIIIRREDGKRVRIVKFLGKDLRILSSRMDKDVGYDPRIRPWYRAAAKTDQTILTDLYVYSSSKEPGITVARRFDGKTSGVFGVDIALANISRFLAWQGVGEDSSIFIFRRNGQMVAYPNEAKAVRTVDVDGESTVQCANIVEMDAPALDIFYTLFKRGGAKGFKRRIFQAGDTTYISRAVAMPARYGPGQFLGIVVPLQEFTGPIVHARTQSMILSLVLLVMFIPVVVWISRRVSHPIRQLEAEAQRIRAFKLDGDVDVPSRVTEIKHLAQAMGAMKSTLASFGMYVPKALVRQIMKNEITPVLGGDRRELSLLFSDIANFTTLSEQMHAEDLAHKVSTYFERLGGVILQGGGTIDKFIGDAIMAFWNAPALNPDHACQACFAALRCRARSRELNAGWEAKGQPPMHTRFGLHTAEAIVGNVGSSDRMDYTAMGAAVNLASRLEGLNKHFGTEILASETVAGRCSDRFLFRTVGKVLPKGTLTPITVFELMGLHCGECALDEEIAVTEPTEEYCLWWEDAFALYKDRRWDEAVEAFTALAAQDGDPVANVYLQRAQTYRDDPPGDDWTGVEAFLTK